MPDAASDFKDTIYKTLTWVLLAALIGVYALYNWYDGTLKRGLDGRENRIADRFNGSSSVESELKAAANDEEAPADARLQAQAKSDAESAAGKIQGGPPGDSGAPGPCGCRHRGDCRPPVRHRAPQSGHRAGRDQGAGPRVPDRVPRCGARRREAGAQSKLSAAADAQAALQSQLEAQQAQLSDLQQTINGQEQALAEAKASQAAELQAQEAQLNDQIQFFRTALEGSEPQRAAQLADLTQRAVSERETREQTKAALSQAQEAMKATEAELAARLEQAADEAKAAEEARVAAEQRHSGAMSEAQGKIFALDEDLKSAKNELATLQGKLNVTVADLNAKIEHGVEALAATQAELDASMLQASEEKRTLEGQIAEAQGRVTNLEETLATERAQAAKQLDDQRRASEESLAQARQEAQQSIAQVRQEAESACAQVRQQAEAARVADREANEQALGYVRGLYSRFRRAWGSPDRSRHAASAWRRTSCISRAACRYCPVESSRASTESRRS